MWSRPTPQTAWLLGLALQWFIWYHYRMYIWCSCHVVLLSTGSFYKDSPAWIGYNYQSTQWTTVLGISEFSSLGRMCCLWWQCHEAAVIKMIYTSCSEPAVHESWIPRGYVKSYHRICEIPFNKSKYLQAMKIYCLHVDSYDLVYLTIWRRPPDMEGSCEYIE
jgi:hypothetical protein